MGSRVGNFVVLGKLFCFFGLLGLGDISWVGNSSLASGLARVGLFAVLVGVGYVSF